MSRGASSFYPPRARWYSSFLTLASNLRRRLALDWIRLPSGVSLSAALASLLLPGVGFYVRGPRPWGKAAIALSTLLLSIIIFWFGYPVASLAFGLLLSVHASALVYLFDPVFAGERFRTRLLFAAAVLTMLACLLYFPARNLVQDLWFFPLRLNGQVWIVRRHAPSLALKRGDQVAYSFDSYSAPGINVQGGLGLGPLLAFPGDHLRFTSSTLEVNGVPQPRLGLMPAAGEQIVPEKHWFVWPQLAISGHGHTAESEVSAAMLNLGTISEKRFLGTPCRRWLWRRQPAS